jgi:hypothetical protein
MDPSEKRLVIENNLEGFDFVVFVKKYCDYHCVNVDGVQMYYDDAKKRVLLLNQNLG